MDYENLEEILPKKSQMWSSGDISKWLQFINLPTLISIFKQAGIDGSCIHLLDEETLRYQLNISSSIIRKKLVNWVGFGLEGYNNFLHQKSLKPILPQQNLQLKKSKTTHLRQESKSKLTHHEPENSEQHLILQQFQGHNLGLHIVKNEPMSIGFGKNNHIHSLETSISERHALVGRNKNGFFIQDLGSKHGTFLKINHRTLLRNDMILQIGSYQFLVMDINQSCQTLKMKQINTYLDIEVLGENNKNSNNMEDFKKKKEIKPSGNSISPPSTNQEILIVDLKDKQKYSFGRRKQNNFQRDDKHMSGMHCKITFFNNNFYIEDYGSTNGTWLRISPQYTASAEHTIEHESYVKLGTAITYICRINKSNITNAMTDEDSEMIDENMCKKCGKSQNNCLFLPCSHNICCMGCATYMSDWCSECGHEIGEKIKIHK